MLSDAKEAHTLATNDNAVLLDKLALQELIIEKYEALKRDSRKKLNFDDASTPASSNAPVTPMNVTIVTNLPRSPDAPLNTSAINRSMEGASKTKIRVPKFNPKSDHWEVFEPRFLEYTFNSGPEEKSLDLNEALLGDAKEFNDALPGSFKERFEMLCSSYKLTDTAKAQLVQLFILCKQLDDETVQRYCIKKIKMDVATGLSTNAIIEDILKGMLIHAQPLFCEACPHPTSYKDVEAAAIVVDQNPLMGAMSAGYRKAVST